MHLPILLFCFASLEAKKQRYHSSSPVPKDLSKIVETEDETFQRPVDFLHVYREGFGDKDYKQPLHLLEVDMIKPKNKEHALEVLQKSNKHNIQWIPQKDSLLFNSPRDEFLYYKKMLESSKNATVFSDKRHVYDFLRMLERNLEYPVIETRKKMEEENNQKAPINKSLFELKKNISDVFQESGFFIKPNKNNIINWTTCDEFSAKSLFHSHDIVNTPWMPFYIWSKRGFSTAVVHIFSYPTKKRVTYYKSAFGPYVKNIDWTQPKLLLKERRELLLISSNRIGFFHGIPDQEAPTPEQGNVTLPTTMVRIKIHSPYIAMMYCDEFYATIMAEQGTEPATRSDKMREASTLGFRGIGLPVYRDFENEKLLAQLANSKILEDEDRKTIKIRKMVGDVDYKVRH